jgi:hypothetical protein
MKLEGCWFNYHLGKNSLFLKYITINKNEYMVINLEIGKYIELNNNYKHDPHVFGHRGSFEIEKETIIFNQIESTSDFKINEWYRDIFSRKYKYKLRNKYFYLNDENEVLKFTKIKSLNDNKIDLNIYFNNIMFNKNESINNIKIKNIFNKLFILFKKKTNGT